MIRPRILRLHWWRDIFEMGVPYANWNFRNYRYYS